MTKEQKLFLPDEIVILINYHDKAAKYKKGCYETQVNIANTEPLYTFGKHQTREDWLRTANEWKRGSDWHLERINFWKLIYLTSLIE